MAGNFSTDLGLPALPLVADPEMFSELLPIYRAIQGLQSALDQYTGVLAQPAELWPVIPPQATLSASNLFRMYRQFAVAAVAGQMMAVDATGKMIIADATTSIKCRGWSTGAVAAGQYGEVITFGGTLTFTAGTLTPGSTYWLGNGGAISPGPGAPLVQPIGFALTDSILVFQPATV